MIYLHLCIFVALFTSFNKCANSALLLRNRAHIHSFVPSAYCVQFASTKFIISQIYVIHLPTCDLVFIHVHKCIGRCLLFSSFYFTNDSAEGSLSTLWQQTTSTHIHTHTHSPNLLATIYLFCKEFAGWWGLSTVRMFFNNLICFGLFVCIYVLVFFFIGFSFIWCFRWKSAHCFFFLYEEICRIFLLCYMRGWCVQPKIISMFAFPVISVS